MANILQTQGLRKYFGGLYAINGVDLAIEEGELRCLIGPNGAGKSTLFKLILGSYAPSEGTIRFRGTDITSLRPHLRVQRGMSIKFQVPGIFVELPVEQNLRIALQRVYRGAALDEELERLLDLVEVRPQREQPAGNLSHGQQQWLEIAMAVALRPALLLLDEPTAHLDPDAALLAAAGLREAAAGRTAIIATHDPAVMAICDEIVELDAGRVRTAVPA